MASHLPFNTKELPTGKVRNLRLFTCVHKMSYRECDWSHHPLTIWDRVILWFARYEWIRSPGGQPTPIVRTKRWRYYFVSNKRLEEVRQHRESQKVS